MPKIKTHKEFINEIFNLVGNEYICLSKYINAHTKIKMKHMCGNEYEIRPHGFLNNNRCPRCSGKIKKTQEQFKKDVKLQDAVIRRLEIMGEATKNIPGSLKEKNLSELKNWDFGEKFLKDIKF